MPGATPDWLTCLRIDIPERVLTARGFHLSRTAADIGRGRLPGAQKSSGIQKVGNGDAIILANVFRELAQYQKEENEPDVIPEEDVNLAPNILSMPRYRAPEDLTGIEASASVVSSGVTVYEKRMPADASWDEAQLELGGTPQPDYNTDADQMIPMDRIIEGKVSYPENCPFAIVIFLPGLPELGRDALCSFYFGGSAPVSPQDATGGQYCITLRGNGSAILWEKTETPSENPEEEGPTVDWTERSRFKFSDNDLGNVIVMKVVPYGRDRLWCLSSDIIVGGPGMTVEGLMATLASIYLTAQKQRFPQHLYVSREAATGHKKLRTSTGAGNVLMDFRRLPQAEIALIRGRYVLDGLAVDGPFQIHDEIPVGTPMRLRIDAYVIPNGVVSGSIHRADTHAALSTNDDGDFLVEDTRQYYVKIAVSSVDGVQTPVIWKYSVDTDPVFGDLAATPTICSTWGSQVVGPDLEPDHESAHLQVRDRLGSAAILRLRDRIRSTLTLVDRTDGSIISHLIEGELTQTNARRMARPNAPNWYDYDVRFTGLWTRIKEQFFQSNFFDFIQDPNAPVNPETLELEELPWKITDAIRFVLLESGVPADEIDVPDIPIRFWAPASPDDVTLRFGADLAKLITTLAKDYLARALVRDPNAGPRGMWRLIPNPQPPYTNFLAHLYLTRPNGYAGRMIMAVDAFGPSTAMFEQGTFETFVKAPEVNTITVMGIGDGPDGDGLFKTELVNPDSFVFNPLRPADYLPHVVPFSHGPDPGLTSKVATNWQARTLYDLAGTGQKWWRGRAPLVLVSDPQDPYQVYRRPLRVNDLIYVAGFPAVVRSANPVKPFRSDRMWLCDYEGRFLG